MDAILLQDATDQLKALGAGKISARELFELSLKRADETHEALNAVVARDVESARRQAAEIDRRRAADDKLGPLAGLPITIKDCFDVDGMPASSGLASMLDRPAHDAVAVARARAAGAVIWGKTNLPVMAADWQSYNDLYGTTNNPWDLTRTPGGSSGGAAAALAAGITALEIGSDIGGSLRIPASFCGIYSHKPTWGLIPQAGHVPPAPGGTVERDLNVIGPMARSARDLRLLLGVLTGAPAPAAGKSLRGLRVGLWLDEPSFVLDPQVRTVLETLAADLEKAGAEVRPIPSPVDGRQLYEIQTTLLGGTIAEDMPPEQIRQMNSIRGLAKLALKLGVSRDSLFGLAVVYTARPAEMEAARKAREHLRSAVATAFEGCDVILAPATPVPAFPHDHSPFPGRKLTLSNGRSVPYTHMLRWIGLATVFGLPATTLPAGRTPGGLPVGAQIIGPKDADALTLAVADEVEKLRGGFVRP